MFIHYRWCDEHEKEWSKSFNAIIASPGAASTENVFQHNLQCLLSVCKTRRRSEQTFPFYLLTSFMANIKLRHKKIDGTRSIFPFVLESFLIVESNIFLFAYLSLPAQAEGSWRDRLRLIGSHKVHSRIFYKNNFLDFHEFFLKVFVGNFFRRFNQTLFFTRKIEENSQSFYWFVANWFMKVLRKVLLLS